MIHYGGPRSVPLVGGTQGFPPGCSMLRIGFTVYSYCTTYRHRHVRGRFALRAHGRPPDPSPNAMDGVTSAWMLCEGSKLTRPAWMLRSERLWVDSAGTECCVGWRYSRYSKTYQVSMTIWGQTLLTPNWGYGYIFHYGSSARLLLADCQTPPYIKQA